MATPTRPCPGCHKQIPADSRFCNYCGAKLAEASPPAQQPTPAGQSPKTPQPPSQKKAEATVRVARPAAAAAPAPDNVPWRQHKDAWNGFTLERPSGWDVRVTHDAISVCADLAGLTCAAIRPVQLPQTVSAAEMARRLVAAIRANNPTFTAWQMNPGDATYHKMQRQADQSLLRIRFTEEGQELVGVLSVMVEGTSALVSGFQAPIPKIAARKSTFERILASFQPIPRLARTAFVEESERAFTAAIPEGWKATGKLIRTPDAGTIFQFRATNPDGTLSAEMPGRYYLFQEAPKGLLARMVPQRYQTMPHMPSTVFLERMLTPEMRQQYPDLQVERIINRADLATSYIADSLQYGEHIQPKNLTAAALQCTFTENGTAYRQRTYVAVQRWPITRVWRVFVGSVVRAPLDQFAQHAATLEGITESVRPEMQWIQAQQQKAQQEAQQAWQNIAGAMQGQRMPPQTPIQPQMPMRQPWETGMGMGMPQVGMGMPPAGTPGISPQEQMAMQQAWQQAELQRLQIMRNANQDIFNMQQAGFQHRMQAQEQQQHDFGNVIRGYQDMRNPYSGDQYNVPIGYNNYWVNGLGQVEGSNWSDSPGLNFQRLDPM